MLTEYDADEAEEMKKTRGGFEVGLMSKALAIANATMQRNAEEEHSTSSNKRSRGTATGKVWMWGSGDYGRLGHGDNLSEKTAKLVEILRDKDVRKIACGLRHTLALTSDGNVYAWGYGGDGQLGHGDL